MRNSLGMLSKLSLLVALATLGAANLFGAGAAHYVVTNDDVVKANANSATFYLAEGNASAPLLVQKFVVPTGGTGVGGGDFATAQVSVLHSSSQSCVYVADGGSSDVAGVLVSSKKVSGKFTGSSTDSGSYYGIGLAMNDSYLYAGFTGSDTIATFQVLAGCTLSFLGDISVSGLNGGWVDGMALNGTIMVVAYGDGSIQSFNIAGGVPVPNNDLQNSTGYYGDGNLPAAVDITEDGHYAIFGDVSLSSVVEVSDISSGQLTPTVVYSLGPGINSSNVRLSPDETLLYISNNFSGQVTAAFFDATTGILSSGCTSGVLKGSKRRSYTGNLATLDPSGTGTVLYVAEGGGSVSYVGIVEVQSSAGQCTLTEAAHSPVIDKHGHALMSIGTFPPRPF